MIQRYDLILDMNGTDAAQSDNGDYVLYSDHLAEVERAIWYAIKAAAGICDITNACRNLVLGLSVADIMKQLSEAKP